MFIDNQKLKRQVRDLKDELKACHAVISTLSNKNFDQAVKIIELKRSLDISEQERDRWKNIAHDIDRTRLQLINGSEGGSNA